MKPRTKARSVALQALYEIDVAGHPPGTVWSQRVADEALNESLAEFAREIIFGVYPLMSVLDGLIAEVYAFAGAEPQVDDITLMLLQRQAG